MSKNLKKCYSDSNLHREMLFECKWYSLLVYLKLVASCCTVLSCNVFAAFDVHHLVAYICESVSTFPFSLAFNLTVDLTGIAIWIEGEGFNFATNE